MDMYSLNCGSTPRDIAPIPSNMTSGNSTNVCPYAILIPDFHPDLVPYATFAANRGPGDITPDTDIVMTVAANSSIDVISCYYVSSMRKFLKSLSYLLKNLEPLERCSCKEIHHGCFLICQYSISWK